MPESLEDELDQIRDAQRVQKIKDLLGEVGVAEVHTALSVIQEESKSWPLSPWNVEIIWEMSMLGDSETEVSAVSFNASRMVKNEILQIHHFVPVSHLHYPDAGTFAAYSLRRHIEVWIEGHTTGDRTAGSSSKG